MCCSPFTGSLSYIHIEQFGLSIFNYFPIYEARSRSFTVVEKPEFIFDLCVIVLPQRKHLVLGNSVKIVISSLRKLWRSILLMMYFMTPHSAISLYDALIFISLLHFFHTFLFFLPLFSMFLAVLPYIVVYPLVLRRKPV